MGSVEDSRKAFRVAPSSREGGVSKGVTLNERWEAIGATTPQAFARAAAPLSPLLGWSHERMPHAAWSGVGNSVKLRNGDQSRPSVVCAAVSLPVLPHDRRRQLKYLGETGSPFRFIYSQCCTQEQHQLKSGAIPRADHLGNVEVGLQHMWERQNGNPTESTSVADNQPLSMPNDSRKPSEEGESTRKVIPGGEPFVVHHGAATAVPCNVATQDMDPVEALAVGNGQKTDELLKKRAQILDRLRMTDALVAELLEYMFGHFGTLKLAFRQLDINGNGSLSSQEFIDGLLRQKSKNGSGPIQVHMQRLFARLDYASKGSVLLEDLVQNLESDSNPMITRLMKFTSEVLKKRRFEEKDASNRFQPYVRLFKVSFATSPLTYDHFCDILNDLKYPSWHATELFRRLDKDDSGNLSLPEFTAFLQKDPPVRRPRVELKEPLGDEHRRQQVQGMFISKLDNSRKLDCQIKVCAHEAPTQLDRLMSRSDDANNKLLRAGLQRAPDGSFLRPDWLAAVAAGMQERRKDRPMPDQTPTKLSRTGSHVLRAHTEPLRDLRGMGCAVSSFNENADRCRISAF